MAPHRTTFVRIGTDLPIDAETAFTLAAKLNLFEYVTWPAIGFRLDAEQRRIAQHGGNLPVGQAFTARLWFFGLLPAWRHTLTVVSYGPTSDDTFEIYTNETSGPARVWNHRLTFEQTGERSCRYTDEIEIEAGLHGLLTKLFILLFFRYRQRRWRTLARTIA